MLYVACWACRSSGGGRWVRSISSLQTGLPTAASRTCSFPHLSQQRLAPPLQRCLLGCTLCPALYCLPCTACSEKDIFTSILRCQLDFNTPPWPSISAAAKGKHWGLGGRLGGRVGEWTYRWHLPVRCTASHHAPQHGAPACLPHPTPPILLVQTSSPTSCAPTSPGAPQPTPSCSTPGCTARAWRRTSRWTASSSRGCATLRA